MGRRIRDIQELRDGRIVLPMKQYEILDLDPASAAARRPVLFCFPASGATLGGIPSPSAARIAMPRIILPILPLLGLAAVPAAAQAPGVPLDSLLRGHAYVLEIREGELAGPAAAFLREATADAQFVTLGENHNTRAIPAFTTALFRMLHREHGFRYLALEEGPLLGRMLSRAVRQPEGAFRLGLRYPSAFHMYTEEELRMMDAVGGLSGAAADPVWGVNQVFGTLHLWEHLAETASDAEARAAARAMAERARPYEGERNARDTSFLRQVMTPADFAAFRAAYRPAAGSEAAWLLEQAELSHGVYAPYSARPRPGFEAFWASGLAREENMRRLFAARYREARAAGDTLPKVLVKSGHTHLGRGLARGNEIFSFGTFLAELAALEGRQAFQVYGMLEWDDLSGSFLGPLLPLVPPGGDGAIVDLRPARAWAAMNRVEGLSPDLRRLIMGYDAFLLLRGKERGSVERLRTPNFRQY